MNFLFIILSLLCWVTNQWACGNPGLVQYEGMCLFQACYYGRVLRVLQFGLENQFNYTTQVVNTNNKTTYNVILTYPDQPLNQIVSDPNCVTWTLYQISNNDQFPGQRQYENPKSLSPTWPISRYSFDTSVETAQITFTLNETDITTRYCKQQNPRIWDCVFSFSFVVGLEQTQISHLFKVTFNLDQIPPINTTLTLVRPASNLPNLQIVDINDGRTVIVNECPLEAPYCTQTQTVNSTLLLCEDYNCRNTSGVNVEQIMADESFYVRHEIDPSDFRTNLTIIDVQIKYTTDDSQIFILDSSEFNITTHKPGFNIYQLNVPLISSNVLITAQAKLYTNASSITDSGQIVFVQLNTGPIGDPNQDRLDAQQNARHTRGALPQDDPNQTLDNSKQNAKQNTGNTKQPQSQGRRNPTQNNSTENTGPYKQDSDQIKNQTQQSQKSARIKFFIGMIIMIFVVIN